MTREEAIFCEKSYIGETNCTDCKYYGMDTCISRESHKMAIKALEQEPCEDAISREILIHDLQELIEAWKEYPVMAKEIKGVEAALGYVKTIPPVKPQPKTGYCENCDLVLPEEDIIENMIWLYLHYHSHSPT